MARKSRLFAGLAGRATALGLTGTAGAQLPEGAKLPLAEEPKTAVLPPASPHWVYIVENVFPHLIAGKVWIVDADKLDVLGMISAGYTPNISLSSGASEIYVAETYWSRGTRGKRTDIVTVYDGKTLEPQGEIPLPKGRFLVVIKKHDAGLTTDGRYMLSFNMAPATTVSVVDVKTRTYLTDIETPGCALVYPTGPTRFSMICADGALLTVDFDGSGNAEITRGEPFFDAENDPVFEHPGFSTAAQQAFFVSYEGMVYPVDFSGATPSPGAPWSLLTDADEAENWRPGGWELAGYHPQSGRLYVQMHQGDKWTHKWAGEEVWVFDTATKTRVGRIQMEEPALSLVVTQDDNPLLITLSEAASISVFDATTLEHKGDLGELGITPYLLYVTGE